MHQLQAAVLDTSDKPCGSDGRPNPRSSVAPTTFPQRIDSLKLYSNEPKKGRFSGLIPGAFSTSFRPRLRRPANHFSNLRF